MEEFEEYLKITFGVKNGTAGSYKNAIIILPRATTTQKYARFTRPRTMTS